MYSLCPCLSEKFFLYRIVGHNISSVLPRFSLLCFICTPSLAPVCLVSQKLPLEFSSDDCTRLLHLLFRQKYLVSFTFWVNKNSTLLPTVWAHSRMPYIVELSWSRNGTVEAKRIPCFVSSSSFCTLNYQISQQTS